MGLRLLWADTALDDLRRIRAALSPEAATRVGRLLAESADCLADFPERGRAASAPDSRELPLPGLPWRLLYRTRADRVMVLRVLG